MSEFIDYSVKRKPVPADAESRTTTSNKTDRIIDTEPDRDAAVVARTDSTLDDTSSRQSQQHEDGQNTVDGRDTYPSTEQDKHEVNGLGLTNGSNKVARSNSLSRTASNGSRFTEDFDDDPEQAHPVQTTRTDEPGVDGNPRAPKSTGLGLFRRRSAAQAHAGKNPPSVGINRVLSRSSTTTTSHSSSLQSASSRRIPSFAATSSPPSSPPTSPTLPSSPRSSDQAIKLGSVVGASHARSGRERTNGRSQSKSPVSSGSIELTPQDRHYICRILTNCQFQREFSALSQIGTLSHYGDPFLPYANGPNSKPKELREQEGKGWFSFLGAAGGIDKEREKEWQAYEWDEDNVIESPLCRYLYWRFIKNMPVLRTAKQTYWTDQIQPFIDSFAERDLSSTKERGEITKRRMLATGITRIVGSYLATSIRPLGSAAPSRPSLGAMHRVDLLVPGSMDSMWRLLHPERPAPEYNAWIAVVEDRARSKSMTVFRIVSRVLVVDEQPLFHATRSWPAIQQFASSLSALDPRNSLTLPLLPYASSDTPASRSAVQTYLRHVVIALSSPPAALHDSEILAEARQILETFLLAGKDHVSKTELAEWVKRGEEQDHIDDRRHRVWVQTGKRVRTLRTIWIKYRKALIAGDELDKTMVLVKKYSTVKAFPKEYREAEEWAKIWVAYALHYIFVGSTNGAEVLNILKGSLGRVERFHDLIPYGAIKVGLALVNPTLAIRAIVQLVLGQPAGQQSLFQRIWSIIVGTAIKHQKKLIEAYKKKLSRASIGVVLEAHVRASYVDRQKTKQVAIDNDEDIVLTIMRERGSGSDVELVDRWHQEFQEAVQANRTGSTKFEDVKNLLAAYYRLRDREQVLAIALEPNTPRLLHASIAVFYDTIYKVANASKLSERVGDLQAFLDDLIQVSLSEHKDPSDFIKLTDRHHEKLYYFVHELAKNGGTLLDPLLDWCRSGLEFIKQGIPPSSTESSPYTRAGVAVETMLDSLPTGTPQPSSPNGASETPMPSRDQVVAEARHFAGWTRYKKVYHDLSLRIDLLAAAQEHDAHEGRKEKMRFDRERMWQEFLSQDREVVQGKYRREDPEHTIVKTRTDAGQDLEWAWWSADELAGAAGQANVSIALPSSSPASSTARLPPTSLPAPGPKKLSRSKSTTRTRGPSEEFDVITHDEVDSRPASQVRPPNEVYEIAAPTIQHTKLLIPKYLGQIKAALLEAKRNQVR
ncbi:uncharacterized protein JCM15063_002576 [Sporobolomyces koalae]|uniref:uncharacterized protein n=1 Tax=Sporobolomyces koalae TaxID=500713 RepID=UPI003179F990